MKLADFDFDLPSELIAQTPVSPRDHARLLVYSRSDKTITDDVFYNLEKYLPEHTTLVINNSKVEKCRLRFPGNIEVFVLETVNPTTVVAMVRPGRVFKVGKALNFAGIEVTTSAVDESGLRTLSFSKPIDDPDFDIFRRTPLPPYIRADESLADEYQTVYAKPLGSKAAPTAGLHFTPQLLTKIATKHVVSEVTLHVGLGTFAPVKTHNISEHIMHAEHYQIDDTAAHELSSAKHITAVGTTSVRVLESAFGANKPHFVACSGSTEIFITPGYSFKAVQSLITNFHLPKSTLLMLVAAKLGSVEELQRVYEHAIKEKYRFYSFGDAMLIV